MAGGDIRDRYRTHAVRVRLNDGAAFTVEADHTWGGRDLKLSRRQITARRLKHNDTLMVALDWYREGRLVWRSDLVGLTLVAAGCL